jgi:hypothetical protein
LLKVRYWKALARLWKVVGSLTGAPVSEETLAYVYTDVVQSLQSVIPAHSRISRAYLRYCTETPKKWRGL